MKKKQNDNCLDCKKNTINIYEYYMVHDHLWAKAFTGTNNRQGVLCIECLEKRLNRQLVSSDFTTVIANLVGNSYDSNKKTSEESEEANMLFSVFPKGLVDLFTKSSKLTDRLGNIEQRTKRLAEVVMKQKTCDIKNCQDCKFVQEKQRFQSYLKGFASVLLFTTTNKNDIKKELDAAWAEHEHHRISRQMGMVT